MLKVLYNTRTGGYVLKAITKPGFSRKCAGILDSKYSRVYIKHFIKRNDIDMSQYICEHWRSFNDFFTRRIRPEARPIDMADDSLISPCDSLLSAYTISADSVFRVKGTDYTVSELLSDDKVANEFAGGMCLIFRMMPVNYHRYIYPDAGSKEQDISIAGKLHTVRPVAQDRYSIYVTNSRAYTRLHTQNFDDVIFMEVGAMMVGRISNHHVGVHSFRRGEEKGYFEYGGSTIIMLLKKNVAHLDEQFSSVFDTGRELPVLVGQRIGGRVC